MAREIGHMLGTILFFETKALLQGKPMSRKRSTNKFYRPQSFRNLWISILAFWLLIITICNYVNYGSHPGQLGWNHFFFAQRKLQFDWWLRGKGNWGTQHGFSPRSDTPSVCEEWPKSLYVCLCVYICVWVYGGFNLAGGHNTLI